MINFKIVIPCFNCEKWIKKTIDSIKSQTYKNFQCIIVDDLSTDLTVQVAQENIYDDNRFSLVINKEKKYALKNFYDIFNQTIENEEDVLINVDGDDWLYSDDVLEKLNNIYVNEKCLLTYGSFIEYPSGDVHDYYLTPYNDYVVKNNLFRDVAWKASHLRTYKAKLFKKIKLEDFIDPDSGNFFEVAADLALMYPMIEMAAERSRHIIDILYVYNKQNPLSDMYIKTQEQIAKANFIKSKTKYEKLREK